ncbi:HlyD family secretion protein [Solirhodobacter olei]|uniref:HlyD family secretion protein n=1 Tax=Solirhodobacter olei TaxID=2493082 RepID=UPI001F4EF704|nr:HlyD family secretion protein [Solirhodobacter olei]
MPARSRGRSRRLGLMISLPLALVLAGGYFWLSGGRYVETQDAQAHQPRVPISSNVSGLVTQVDFHNNQRVQKGAVLFKVDPKPFQLAVEQAEAGLSQARLKVQQLKAAYGAAVTQQKVAADQVSFEDSQLARQDALAKRGAATQEALDQARNADVVAKGQLATAKQAVASAAAALNGNPDIAVDDHPTVRAALAALDSAKFNLSQATVRAPADGIVYKAESFKPGQYVTTGASVFTLVETKDVWVEADFKETQLTHVKPGQAVTVTFDLYPNHVFHGTVSSIGAGTGAEFALIPAENATGNWVKVTQRIPTTIHLTDTEASLPLHSGMSASVSVDTGITRSLGNLIP